MFMQFMVRVQHVLIQLFTDRAINPAMATESLLPLEQISQATLGANNRMESVMAKLSGGGSNKMVTGGVKTGPARVNVTSPAGAGQIGATVAFKKDQVNASTKAQVPLGNAKALDVGAGGPGKGRDVHVSGIQGTHGPVVQGELGVGPCIELIRSTIGPNVLNG
jgi:hypothetical protein